MRRLLPLILIVLAGCKGRDTAAVGTWKSNQGSVTIFDDGKFASQIGSMNLGGTWTKSGPEIALTPTTFDGKPLAEKKDQLLKSVASLPISVRSQAQKMVQSIEATRSLTLSEDGKTLSTDRGPWAGIKLTKG